MPEFNTIEEARAEILRLNGEVTRLENERDTLSQNNTNLNADLERVRTLNQNYFNQLSAQYSKTDDKNNNDEEEVATVEEFAKTLIKHF